MKTKLVEEKKITTENILQDVCNIIDEAKSSAYTAVNVALVKRNWLIGKRIAEEELKGKARADYGDEVIRGLAKDLTKIYGKGFTMSNLYHFLNFYKCFPEIFYTVCRKSRPLLSWSHYRILLQVQDQVARNWYESEALEQTWSVRTLQRNVDTQYYYRLLKSQKKEPVIEEMLENNKDNQKLDKLEFVKNPVIAEFLGYTLDSSYTETELETRIIDNLQKFMMELGKGYAFVARQQLIRTEKEDYYIDLVFYNYILKCFILIDLKTKKITHQDVGQMDMYVRMFDDLKRAQDDNPTIGIILCTDKDETIVKYSVLNDSRQIFASKYMTVLPTEEELAYELEKNQNMLLDNIRQTKE